MKKSTKDCSANITASIVDNGTNKEVARDVAIVKVKEEDFKCVVTNQRTAGDWTKDQPTFKVKCDGKDCGNQSLSHTQYTPTRGTVEKVNTNAT